MFTLSPVAPLTRALPVVPPPRVPASVRYPWHRVSMLLTLGLLCAFPWLTSRGCEGKSEPTTYTGAELLWDTLSSEPIAWLGPVCLVLAAFAGFAVVGVRRAGRRLLAMLGVLALTCVGAFYTFLCFEMPVVADVVDHHVASHFGYGVLAVLLVESLVRVGLAGREWWIDRRARGFEEEPRRTSTISAL